MDRKSIVVSLIQKVQEENDGKHIDYIIPGYAAKRLVAYQSIRADLIACKEALLQIKAKQDEIINLALYHTVIILYGKCFVNAASSKSPKLEIKDCFTITEQDLLQAHQEIIELRHSFTAHRGTSENDIGIAYMSMNIDTLERRINVKQRTRRAPKNEDYQRYLKLFDHIISIVETKFQKEANRVGEHLFEKYSPEELTVAIIAKPKKETK